MNGVHIEAGEGERVMRLALLNTRAHNIFRPWF
jgi:hypothetical protein